MSGNKNELERVKKDLEVMQEAAGLELPFGWEDVWLYAVGAPAYGIWVILWALLLPGGEAMNLLKMMLACVPALPAIGMYVFLRYKYRRGSGRSAIRRREYSSELIGMAIIALFLIPYGVFLLLMGCPKPFFLGMMWFFLGMMVAVMAFPKPGRLHSLGGAIGMMACGVVIPLCSVKRSGTWTVRVLHISFDSTVDSFLISIGIVCIVGGLISAGIMAYQLWSSREKNVPD
jgi:hypothetical protein